VGVGVPEGCVGEYSAIGGEPASRLGGTRPGLLSCSCLLGIESEFMLRLSLLLLQLELNPLSAAIQLIHPLVFTY
jgi:hypothetical protein